jgi:hypothetical protein
MWQPRRLTTLWAFTACCRDSFTFYLYLRLLNVSRVVRPRYTEVAGSPPCLLGAHWNSTPIKKRGRGPQETELWVETDLKASWGITQQVSRMHTSPESESESYVTTDGQSASLSWSKVPIWGLRPDLCYCQTVVGLFMWDALSDERTGLSFTIAAGPSPVGLAIIFYCLRFETSLFVTSYDSQGYGGGIRLRLHTGFIPHPHDSGNNSRNMGPCINCYFALFSSLMFICCRQNL